MRAEGGASEPRVRLFEADGCPRPLPAETKAFIDDLFTGRGPWRNRPVFLHPGPGLGAADPGVVAEALRNGWKNLLDFRLDAVAPEASPVLPEYEMVILVLVGPGGGQPPALAVVYPFLTLEPYMKVLGA